MPGTQASGFVPGVLTPVRAPQAAPPPLHPPHPSPPSSCPLSTPGLLADSPSWVFLGESFLQLQQRLLRDREAKIQKALERLRCKRRLLGQQRRRKEFPVVSVVGYTNCGEGRVRDWGLGGARGRGPPQGAAGGRGLPGAGLSWWAGPPWGRDCPGGWGLTGAGLVDGPALEPGLWVGSPSGCIGGQAPPGLCRAVWG